ncbi:MAG TPA: alpha/beta hydrolase [Burkholderiaceae bacterium]|nr:alpha/beta hydrolase [Burkholderiaceae bacterium]
MSTWVFLRGLTRESRHWGDFIATFEATLPGARVLTPDLPGNGRRRDLRSPLEVPALAASCRAQAALPPGTRTYLLGLSLGAMAAVAWAQQHPHEVAGCVLINTSVRPFCPFYRRLRPTAYPLALRALCGGDEAMTERAVLRLTSRGVDGNGVPTAAVLPAWIAYRRDSPVARANAVRQLIAAARFRAPPAPPACPVLVLASAADRLVDVRCSRALALAWRARYAEHPSAGHDLPLDDGPWVAQRVRDWVAADPAAASAPG